MYRELDIPSPTAATITLPSITHLNNRDFVLLVRTETPHEPRVFVEQAPDGSSVSMLTLAPNVELDDELCELVFVVDCSGSMEGTKIEQARNAMNVCTRERCYPKI
jgi:hypothetical protein